MKKVIISVIIVLLVAVIGAGVGLIASGKLAWVDSQTVASSSSRACGDEIIAQYNEAMFLGVREDDTEPTLDEAAIAAVKTTILETQDYAADPSCQTMLFWVATLDEDYEATRTARDALVKQNAQNIFPSNNIRGNQPLFTYDAVVDSLSPEAQTSEGLGGS